MYKKTKNGRTGEENPNIILRTTDNLYIPVSEGNIDYQEYLAWVAEGNTAEAAD